MDEKIIAEVISQTLGDHLKKNGTKQSKTIWIRFAVQLIVAAVILTSVWFGVKSEIERNTLTGKMNCEAIKCEVRRSVQADERLARDVTMIDKNMAVMATEQKNIGVNIKEIKEELKK